MSDTVSCHVCGWDGDVEDLRQPPTGDELYYCPECATSIDVP